ncbi:hypothetical protein CANCADRAFT_24178 [Tortispora caseinolytica NRRL Y-17796]|uniref:N-acetyltransferase domain-containing protein n=1 Tax=Tortispora caseinolytica NRRL Y-17796 TaxID=767744 RepID=A0A1E4TEY9_9ASCO|nr:hypothetical protein CANCADRAFT_24178 [Tortispora caseinolytica NRRL Y-17796]
MTSIKPFSAMDLFDINNINLDVLTENYQAAYYLDYLSRWPSLFFKTIDSDGAPSGYMIGKAEGKGTDWHGHVTAVTVAEDHRRLGLGRLLVNELERVTDEVYKGYFLDLFVRVSNDLAISMYKNFGFSVYRRVVGYYYDEKKSEDAYDMRKPLKRDTKRESVRENGESFRVSPREVVF